VYGTIALSYHSVFGPELDGKGYYQPNSADLFAVPEVSGGLGFRATAGLRYSTFAVGVAYSQSYHDGAWFGLDKEIVRRALLLEGAVPLPAWGSARPYLRGALGTEWVTVNEGYYHQYGELVFVADPTYFGLGGEGVIGIEYPLGSHVSLVADVGFHTFSLLQVSSNSGYRPDVNLNPSLLDMGLEACCGVSVMWTF